MPANHNAYTIRWPIAIVVILLFSFSNQCIAGDTNINPDDSSPSEAIELTLKLDAPSANTNQFGIQAGLNALVPGRGMDMATSSVDWTGEFKMHLYIDSFDNDGMPIIAGINLPESTNGIEQSPATLSYSSLPVDVQFKTSTIMNTIEQQSSSMVNVQPGSSAGEFQFAPDVFHVMQKSGEAGVAVETRPTEMQDLDSNPIGMGMVDSISSLAIEPMDGYEQPTYRVIFRMPLGGQVVKYDGTGLPVEWTYGSGDVVASGTFSLESTNVPEPSTIAMIGVLATLVGAFTRKGG